MWRGTGSRLLLAGLGALLSACQVTSMTPASGDAAGAAPPLRLQAIGTEPFWSIRIEGDDLLWTDPEHPEGKPFVATLSREAHGLRWQGELDGHPAALELWEATCSDGMSDSAYTHTVRWTHAGRKHHGCARVLTPE